MNFSLLNFCFIVNLQDEIFFVHGNSEQDLYKVIILKTSVIKLAKNNVTKVYCTSCDLVFDSRKTFEKHLVKHSSNALTETCPIDTAIIKLLNILKRKSSHNLE
ncbi:MAG: hypothetical protein HW410_1130 [Nitrosarchaeum sp.]|nr:hypothetical protein [Nitrosarchaeum sp.]